MSLHEGRVCPLTKRVKRGLKTLLVWAFYSPTRAEGPEFGVGVPVQVEIPEKNRKILRNFNHFLARKGHKQGGKIIGKIP